MVLSQRAPVVMVPLAALAAGYVLLPTGLVRDASFTGMGLACVVTAYVGLRRASSVGPGWWLILAGFLGWVLGDGAYSLQMALGWDHYPGPADAFYVVAYALMVAGLVMFVPRRRARGELTTLLDAAVVATGVAVVTGAFVLLPISTQSDLSGLGKVTAAFYPIADILLLGVLVRAWSVPAARTSSVRLVMAALGAILAGDAYYTLTAILHSAIRSQLPNDLVWYAGYVLLAGAAWDRSARAVPTVDTQPRTDAGGQPDPSRQLLVLVGGLLLPPVVLLIDGLDGDPASWPIVAAGSIVMSMLVLAQVGGLLRVVGAQSTQLAELARSDSLTGVPNRRTWDFELSRACRVAREDGTTLSIAIVDLDHFKDYNDTYGHPAGDRLLKEATSAWTAHLRRGEVLARVGGEEFGLLLPGRDAETARARVLTLLAATPGGQTFSAGVATWHPDTQPSVALKAADEALYAAKRGGRNQVRIAPYVPADLLLPQPRIALQPLVALSTGEVVGYEALSRFVGESSPLPVFEQARTLGRLAELEAAAIGSARMVAPRDLLLTVNVDISSLATPEVQDALAGDLAGVVLEVTEHTHSPVEPQELALVKQAIEDYRGRGAILAVDDWGTGYSDMARLDLLEPEIVKLDISVVHDLDSVTHRALMDTVLAWTAPRGARICGEGIEDEGHLERLRELGVHLGQGFYLGRPEMAAAHSFDAVH